MIKSTTLFQHKILDSTIFSNYSLKILLKILSLIERFHRKISFRMGEIVFVYIHEYLNNPIICSVWQDGKYESLLLQSDEFFNPAKFCYILFFFIVLNLRISIEFFNEKFKPCILKHFHFILYKLWWFKELKFSLSSNCIIFSNNFFKNQSQSQASATKTFYLSISLD